MTLSASALRRLATAGQFGLGLACAAALARWAGWRWPAAALGRPCWPHWCSAGRGRRLRHLAVWRGRPRHAAPCRAAGSRHRPLGAAAALACYLYECTAVFRMFNWIEPFRSSLSFVPPHAGAPARPPLLLVHGYACNHAVWLDLQPALAAAGYACEAIDLLPLFDSIDNHAGTVLARMRAIHARTGRAPLLLCHSMGGLAARAALVRGRAEGGAPCAGLVTLGSPHRGCALASLGAGASARQMRCDSPAACAGRRRRAGRTRPARLRVQLA